MSGNGNQDFNPSTCPPSFEWHSTRLFPKGQGAHRVLVTGIAACCDWAVVSDTQPPEVEIRRLVDTDRPRLIFLSLRNPFAAILYFAESVLPLLRHPFILITGSEDITLPLQCDHRWRAFNAREDQCLQDIASHPHLVHWFAENLDWSFSDRLSPLPLGVLPPPVEEASLVSSTSKPVPLEERELLILCANRIREGPQWEQRSRLREWLVSFNQDQFILPEHECPAAEYAELLRKCSFVVCASGGGWDPCPKLWHALIHGSIPIVKRSSLVNSLSEDLPMWIVDHWRDIDWSQESLLEKRTEILSYYPDYDQLQTRLSLTFWRKKVESHLECAQ